MKKYGDRMMNVLSLGRLRWFVVFIALSASTTVGIAQSEPAVIVAAPSIASPLVVEPAPVPTPEIPLPGAVDGTPLLARWRNGLRFESADKVYSLFIGGRFQFDTVGYLSTRSIRDNVPGTVPLEEGVSFRRIRLDMGGTIYKNVEFYSQIEFANGFSTTSAGNRLTSAANPTDMWVTFKELPVIGNVRIGNHKPLYSFEHHTSSRYLNFMERSVGFDAFAEGFNGGFEPGVSIFDTYDEKRGTWGLGLFKTTRSPLAWNVGRDETEVNGRVTYLPVYDCDGRSLVHLGIGAAVRNLDDDQIRFRARFDARNSPGAFTSLASDTGLLYGDRQQLLIPEFAAVFGPLSFQSELYTSWVQGAARPNPDGTRSANRGNAFLWSAYGEVHYFLTGEHREYNRDSGAFTRVVPLRPFAWDRSGVSGWGAWQLAARYSYLDLNSGAISGGRLHDWTLGVNWFMNPNMKAQFNYFLTKRDSPTPLGNGLIHGFAARMAIDF